MVMVTKWTIKATHAASGAAEVLSLQTAQRAIRTLLEPDGVGFKGSWVWGSRALGFRV